MSSLDLQSSHTCPEPKHNSFRNQENTREGDLKFKHDLDESTNDQTYIVNALLYLHNDGTFDYSVDGYSANDEMGSTLTNAFFGTWSLTNNSLTLVPIYKHKYLSEGWELIDSEHVEKQTITTKNYDDGNSVLAWNASRYTDTITCFSNNRKEVIAFQRVKQ